MIGAESTVHARLKSGARLFSFAFITNKVACTVAIVFTKVFRVGTRSVVEAWCLAARNKCFAVSSSELNGTAAFI
jgi:hypothetical protein